MDQLPAELVSHVVRHLSNDPSSLRAASQVSSRLLEPTQRILFRKLELRRPRHHFDEFPAHGRDYRPGAALLAIFKQSPHLATYTKDISIRNHVFTRVNFWSGVIDVPGWLGLDNDLPLALELIPIGGVKSVTMEGLSPWNVLPEATKQVLANILRSPSLLVLEINYAPIHLLNLCGPSVIKFKTEYLEDPITHEPFDGLPTQPEQESPMRLQAIGISFQPAENSFIKLLLDPNSHFDISGLNVLETTEMDVALFLGPLIKICAASLRILSFEAPQEQTDLNLNLSGCVSLEEVVVRGMLIDPEPEIEGMHCVFPLMEALESIPSCAPLECINIRIHHSTTQPIKAEPWMELDNFLSLRIPNRLPSLARIVVYVQWIRLIHGVFSADEVKSQYEGSLPKLLRLGLLNVTLGTSFDRFDRYLMV
ncbi:hypothetical protein FA15DRAFT_675071 [Coprinopsis marcescibilis]|uniref:F-box domain-containing protein n=1 Tax=Coprinopsis marcescibilis TaxID=230819 RepID=A0A5C3KGH1_COPMA|nr:hypothetical protein FA15DRAFT_675071 [Coprinopsis marcescibilis]